MTYVIGQPRVDAQRLSCAEKMADPSTAPSQSRIVFLESSCSPEKFNSAVATTLTTWGRR